MQSILLVSSSEIMHPAISEIFGQEPLAIHTASNGEQGLTLGRRLLPDIILLDDDLPKLSSLEVLGEFRRAESTRQTPVVILQHESNPAARRDAYKLGATEVIHWPIDREEFFIRIRNLLEKRRLERLLEESALLDPLTGLNSRQRLESQLRERVALHQRYGQRFGLVLVEIDSLRRIVQQRGTVHGDRVIQMVASVLCHNMREEESLCRFSETSFAIVLYACDRIGAERAAARFMKTLRGLHSVEFGSVTASFGVATCDAVPVGYPMLDGIICAAQKALQGAKGEGGNSVQYFSGLLQPKIAFAL